MITDPDRRSAKIDQNSFKPGGSGKPPVTVFIFSCSNDSAFLRASA
jgi:hypothetical protein